MSPRRLALSAALATVYLVWGSTYLAIRVLVDAGAAPMLGMGTRFAVAGVILGVAVGWRRGWAALRVSSAELRGAALLGVLLLTTGNGMLGVVEQGIDSGAAALLAASVPLMLVVLRVAAGQRPAGRTLWGTALGFCGITLIATAQGVGTGNGRHVLLLLAAGVSWSVGSFVAGRVPVPRHGPAATAWQMVLGGVALSAAGLAAGETAHGPVVGPPRAWLAWAYLVLFGSVIAFSAYAWLLRNAPISLTGTYAFVNPVVATALGTVVLHERISPAVAAGGLLAVGAVAVVVSGERHRPPTPAPRPTTRAAAPEPTV